MSRDPHPTRTVTVRAERLSGWVQGFAARHGTVVATPTADGFDLTGADGARAEVSTVTAPLPLPPWPPDPGGADALAAALSRHLLAEPEVAVLLARRGGYAVARLRGLRVLAAKVGSRYVQGRTAAGGWSQQRFARRRENQTSALVAAAAQVAARLLPAAGDVPPAQVLVTGGDRALVQRILQEARVPQLGELPRGPHLAVGDPRSATVQEVASTLRTVRVMLTDPGAGS